MKTFECEVRCTVFARVFVEAESEKEARRKVMSGGSYWQQVDFEKHTARADDDEIESIKEVE